MKLDLDCHYFFGVKKCQYPSPQFTSSIGTSSLIIWSFWNSNFFLFHFCVLKMGVGILRSRFIMNYTTASHTFFSQQQHLLLEDGMFLIWMATIAQCLGIETHFLGFWNFVKLSETLWNFANETSINFIETSCYFKIFETSEH